MRDKTDLALEAFVDGQLDEGAATQFAKSVEDQPELADQIKRSREIDASLARLFASSAEQMPPLVLPPEGHHRDAGLEAARSKQSNKAGWYALAACVAWLCVGGYFLWPSDRFELVHRQRPLQDVYEECVDRGFTPYWVCDDPALFAATFKQRQGVPLELAPLPAGSQMEGLAYLAGLSLDSTSMLARVEGQPVLLFVDDAQRAWSPPTGRFETGDGDEIVVQRTERRGLVFYQVGPDVPLNVADYLRIAVDDPPAAGR